MSGLIPPGQRVPFIPPPLPPAPTSPVESLAPEPPDYGGAFWNQEDRVIWDDDKFTISFMGWWNKQQNYYSELLEPTFQKIQEYMRRYLLKREDWRDEDTQWRAFVTDPGPMQIIETIVQSVVEIFGGATPLVQAESVGAEAFSDAKAIENEIDAVLRKNQFNLFLDDLTRHILIQGFQPIKIIHGRLTTKIRRVIDESDWRQFEESVHKAEMQLNVPAPTDDPIAFDLWRKMVSDVTGGKLVIPEIPVPGVQEQVLYEGPMLKRPSVFTLRFDPSIADWQQQPVIMQRFIVPAKFIEERTDWTGVESYPNPDKPWCRADPSLPFHGPAVEKALKAGGSQKVSEWEAAIAKMLGYDKEQTVDPSLENPCELFENWMPAGDQVKHVFVLNRDMPINKAPEYLEYDHGMAPWANIRNVPVEGSLGVSELEPSWSSFEEREKLRELFLDSAAIQGIPMILNLTNSGLDEEEVQSWYPGKQFRPARADGLQMLKLNNTVGLSDLLKAIGFLRSEQDDTHATWGNARGQEATVSRVTADESRSRLSQALLRQKARVSRWSEELQPVIYQILGLLAQYSNPDSLIGSSSANPFNRLPKQRFYDSLFQIFRLRGPLDHLNKLQNAEQLMAFAKTFGPFIRPEEQRVLMESVLRNMGIKEISQILTPQGTQQTVAAFNMPVPGALPNPNALAAGGQPPGPPVPGGPPQGGGNGAT